MIAPIESLAKWLAASAAGTAVLGAAWKVGWRLYGWTIKLQLEQELSEGKLSKSEVERLKTAVETLEGEMARIDEVLSTLTAIHTEVKDTREMVNSIQTETIPQLHRAIGRLEGQQKPTYDRRSG